jgi:hypothetical protein
LAKSATSVAFNYRASCRARSHAEFTAKTGLVAEEADELGLDARRSWATNDGRWLHWRPWCGNFGRSRTARKIPQYANQ